MSTCGGTGGRTGGRIPSVGSDILSMKENGISSVRIKRIPKRAGGRQRDVYNVVEWGRCGYCTRIIMEVAPSFPQSSTIQQCTGIHTSPTFYRTVSVTKIGRAAPPTRDDGENRFSAREREVSVQTTKRTPLCKGNLF